MNSFQLHFQEVAVSNAERILAQLVSGVVDANESYQRAAARNIIALGNFSKDATTWPEEVQALLRQIPGRYFILSSHPDVCELATSRCLVSAFCWTFSAHEHLCNEVLLLPLIEGTQAIAAQSVLASLKLSDVKTSLLIPSTSTLNTDTVLLFTEVCDEILLSSHSGSLQAETLAELLGTPCAKIDADWIQLAPWREECLRMFRRIRSETYSGTHISILQVRGVTESRAGGLPQSFLLCGWLLVILDLQVLSYSANQGFECVDKEGERIFLQLVSHISSQAENNFGVSGLSVEFEHEPVERQGLAERWTWSILHEGGTYTMQAIPAGNDKQHSEASSLFANSQVQLSWKALSPAACFQNYFAVGHTVQFYREVFSLALECFSLFQGQSLQKGVFLPDTD